MDTIEAALKFFKEQNFQKALEYFEKALKKDSQNYNILNNIGLCQYNLGNFDKACKFYKKALNIENNLPQTVINLSDCYIKMNRVLDAIDVLQNFVYQYPDNEVIKHYLARVYLLDKRIMEAIATLEEILDKNPENFEASWDLAQAYFDLGDWENAICNFESTIEHSSTQNPLIFYQTALAYEADNQISKAISNHLKAIVYNEKFSLPYKKLGTLFMAQGDYKSAVDYFKDYMDCDIPEQEKQQVQNISNRIENMQ